MKELLGKYGSECLTNAAAALEHLLEERHADGADNGPAERLFGRIMDLAIDDAPMVAMLALLAPTITRFPPAWIPVDQIAAMQDDLSDEELAERMRAACDALREVVQGAYG